MQTEQEKLAFWDSIQSFSSFHFEVGFRWYNDYHLTFKTDVSSKSKTTPDNVQNTFMSVSTMQNLQLHPVSTFPHKKKTSDDTFKEK